MENDDSPHPDHELKKLTTSMQNTSMQNEGLRAEDLPDDLTPFITRTTQDHVGGGGFGDVWKCNYNRDNISALVAVKVFRLPDDYGINLETINRKISREIGILKILRHNNIVPLWGIATGFGRMSDLRCLVSPWIPNGTLNVYLASNRNVLTVLDRSRMLEDVSAGLRYLHSESVMHGDITGANILIDKGGHARLIDFGLSTIVQPLLGQSHLAATSIRPGAIRYAAPELVLPADVPYLGPLDKHDIYSFGCVMLQVLSGRPPWSEIQSSWLISRITLELSAGRGLQRPWGHPEIIDSDWKFIQKCLQFEPELRPSADKVIDFVMHRFSSPDSCSRPPGDAPDDAPDDSPGASGPLGGSNDSDPTEQSPNSPPLHPDHEPKTLTMVIDQSSASASSTSAYSVPFNSSGGFSASISNPPYPVLPFSDNNSGIEVYWSPPSTLADSVPPSSHNYSSVTFSGSSTAPALESHALEEGFNCMWGGPNGLLCDDLIHGYNLSSHLREVHEIRGPGKLRIQCRWNHCDMLLNKESLLRHVEEAHLEIVYSCECGKTFSRKSTLAAHKRGCSDWQ